MHWSCAKGGKLLILADSEFHVFEDVMDCVTGNCYNEWESGVSVDVSCDVGTGRNEAGDQDDMMYCMVGLQEVSMIWLPSYESYNKTILSLIFQDVLQSQRKCRWKNTHCCICHKKQYWVTRIIFLSENAICVHQIKFSWQGKHSCESTVE